jgi:predicted nucleotidyltransferase
MRVIRRFARDVADRFHPDKIILFGSYAYGTPHTDSDVDILVIMPARNQLDQAVKIELACDPPFPLDIIVRTPHNMHWRLAEGESFLREIMTKGRVLYEKNHAGVGPQSPKRLPARHRNRARDATRDGNTSIAAKTGSSWGDVERVESSSDLGRSRTVLLGIVKKDVEVFRVVAEQPE